MRAVDIIARKRDGGELSRSEISFVVRAYTSGEIADYQMAALLMAIYLRGMSREETIALTEEMHVHRADHTASVPICAVVDSERHGRSPRRGI